MIPYPQVSNTINYQSLVIAETTLRLKLDNILKKRIKLLSLSIREEFQNYQSQNYQSQKKKKIQITLP